MPITGAGHSAPVEFMIALAERGWLAVPAEQTDPHGHAHDREDVAVDGQTQDHRHGHNASDHSHETPSAVSLFAAAPLNFVRTWDSPGGIFPCAIARQHPERPPKFERTA